MDIKDVLKYGATGLAIAAFGGGLFYLLKTNEVETKKQIAETTEAVKNKVMIDITKQAQIPLRDGYTIDLTHINLQDGKNLIGQTEKSLNIFGVVDEQYAFKNEYKLTHEEFVKLTKKEYGKNSLDRLAKVIDELVLSEHAFTDVKALSLGFTEEKDFKNFAKVLGPAKRDSGFFRSNYEMTADFYLPIYSEVEIVEVNGEKVGVLKVEGVEVHEKSTPNYGLGLIMGSYFYQADYGYAMSYALGLTYAMTMAIEHHDTYFRVEQFSLKLSAEQQNFTEEQLREHMISNVLGKNEDIIKETLSYSENMRGTANAKYADLYDAGMELKQ